jgi:hypothetical protein
MVHSQSAKDFDMNSFDLLNCGEGVTCNLQTLIREFKFKFKFELYELELEFKLHI